MTIELPGLFDLQVNGFGGIDFNAADLTRDDVELALGRLRRAGVTRCLPTLITSSFDQFAAAARVLSRMRTYLILRDRARQWNADTEIQAILASLNSTASAFSKYSKQQRDALLATAFDREALAGRGLGYERLDQLTMEVLLGVR